ncbi:ImmA/IrrE family metallo-endopeptidase [Clostridium estertheticum]|uniref:ImmA/IrrE family metallo-endopeptidase n=1 Tax=Clostridium estertheticum TaxID=238834 RepID=UPI001C6EF363|nr:ImmA/IrrE family metallo-endopeptidase [Clostridium estertheticum]MBW9151349.1 ImmA/IrrE family metallo-endopeptidase [Clostridium estertheticum]WLC84676.1 ImmA/IrrE family metallo-endopeptidase [Clostridium estertheticum]
MDEFLKLAYDSAVNFRDKYDLGNYCAKQLLEILDLLEITERIRIKLIRTPFSNLNLAGFIGYKHGAFVIVTNTNHTLGSERFTIAHEIYHLLEDRVFIKNNFVVEEMVDANIKNIKEIMANAFAIELLMPKDDICSFVDEISKNGTKHIDPIMVVRLQQKYGVDYAAITKRLYEIGKINVQLQEKLNETMVPDGQLENITKNLGYTNELNLPSMDTHLLQNDLEILKENYDNKNTTYDDLVRIFSYLGCKPEKFGYEDGIEITDDAKAFMKSLLD